MKPDATLLSTAGADATVAQSPGMRVTKQSIEDKIAQVGFIEHGTTTICLITMANGFTLFGTAGCADPANYNKDVGRRYAYDDAFAKIWPLEGYLLAEQRRIHGLPTNADVVFNEELARQKDLFAQAEKEVG